MFFGMLTIDNDGFSMVLGLSNHWFQWFSMVKDHWSNDGMVSMDRTGLAQCLRHVFEEGFLTTGVNSGVNICPNNGLTIQGLDFGTYFLKFFRSILEPFHQDYCYFHDKNGKTIFGKVKRLPKANNDTP